MGPWGALSPGWGGAFPPCQVAGRWRRSCSRSSPHLEREQKGAHFRLGSSGVGSSKDLHLHVERFGGGVTSPGAHAV